jgi:hypothetical protein
MKRHPGLSLAICLAVIYVVLGNNRITSGDGEAMFQVTRALVEQGRLDLPPGILPAVETILTDTTDTQIPYTVVGHDGRTYSKYGLGQSLAALPLYLLGAAWRTLTGVDHAPRTAATLLNSLLIAAISGLLVSIARELGYSTRIGILLGVAFAFCSPAWAYTHTFFSEPLVTCCLTGAALAILRFDSKSETRWLVLMAGLLGFALVTRINAIAALPAFGLCAVLAWRSQRPPTAVIAQQIAWASAAFGVSIGVMLLYNLARFDHPFDFGYETSNWQTPFLRGLFGQVLSPGKGLLWYAPPIWLGLIGLPSFARRRPRAALLCGGVVLGYVLFHSPYTYWGGGWSWGPRFLIPVLPFALLPAGSLLSRQKLSRIVELALAAILAVGFLVQLPAVGSYYAHALQRVYASHPEDFETQVLYRPANSPLVRQWLSLLEVTANLRNAQAREEIADLLATAQPDDELLLADSSREALRLEQQAILAFNLPDLWLVTSSWLRQEEDP